MKIAFDENMPSSMVRVFKAIGDQKGFKKHFRGVELVFAKDYTPQIDDLDYVAKDDAPWLVRYKKAGGKIVISGDVRMPRRPHQLLAITEQGLSIFFFPEEWNNWQLFRKSAFILVWMDRIIEQSRRTKRSTLYTIPKNWKADCPIHIMNPPGPLRLKEMDHPVRPERPKARRRPRKERDTSAPLLEVAGLLPEAQEQRNFGTEEPVR